MKEKINFKNNSMTSKCTLPFFIMCFPRKYVQRVKGGYTNVKRFDLTL